MIHVNRHADATAFLERAESWLLRAEAEHNLLLGIAHQLRAEQQGEAQSIYLATLERDGVVVGCAFRTPPYKFGVTALPPEAIAPLAADVNSLYDALPAVLGPESAARAFALAWSARTGAMFEIGMRQRIYQLTRVTPPSPPVPGALRIATMDDGFLLDEWIDAFTAEAHGPLPGRDIAARIAQGAYHLWCLDNTPRCLVGLAARTPNGVRVGPVYTPPSERGRGFASAAVAAVSQQQLDAGARFCFLYTDLSNETSNSIYQRIGYEPVCDVIDCNFS